MTIAVTGATGQLGSRTVRRLLDRGEDVVAVVRDAQKAADLADAGARVAVAVYGDVPGLTEAFRGVGTVALISGSEVGQRVAQHASVVEAAQAAGVGRIVYTSAPKADDSPLVLAPEHAASERLVIDSGLDYTIVRNNWYTENYAATIAAAKATGEVVTATGSGRVASATRDDFADGLVAVLVDGRHSGRIYEFAGDEPWDFDEFAGVLTELLGQPVTHRAVDVPALVEHLRAAGLDEATAGFTAALDDNIAAGALEVHDRTLSELIGRGTTPLADGLRELV